MMTAFAISGGLALFILGMQSMTDGLRVCAGASLRKILSKATHSSVSGMGLGTIIGFLVQSSATTVMIVGFINAGLMNLSQSVPVMLGANVGATLSMQLISFKLADYCFGAIFIGFLLKTVVPHAKVKAGGKSLLGFGLLFLGMSTMSGAIAPYREAFIPIFHQIDGSTIGGMIRGVALAALITGVIQSSGAVIGITFALIEAGVITDLPGAFPIIIGANIGTCVTALLGSIGTHIEAKQSAISHLTFNIFSTLLAAVLSPLFYKFIPMLGGGLVHQAANANTIKMALSALLVLPFAKWHVAFIRKIMPARSLPPQPSFLDDSLTSNPEEALGGVMRELCRITDLCRESLALDTQLLERPNQSSERTIYQNEKTINSVKLAINDYLEQLLSHPLSQRQAMLAQHLDRCADEIERIGDHLTFICKLNRKIQPHAKKQQFKEYLDQLRELHAQVSKILTLVYDSLSPDYENRAELAQDIIDAQKAYIKEHKTIKKLITQHLGDNALTPLIGIYLNEYQMSFSKIARHCKVIAGTEQRPFFLLKNDKEKDAIFDEDSEGEQNE